MQGSLDQFELRAVVEALSLGRQSVGIEVFAGDGRRLGALYIKGGQLLSATCGRSAGVPAALELLKPRERGRFVVFKARGTRPGEALQALQALLRPALKEEGLLEVDDDDISEADGDDMPVTQVAARPSASKAPPAKSRPPPLPVPSSPPPSLPAGVVTASISPPRPSTAPVRMSEPPHPSVAPAVLKTAQPERAPPTASGPPTAHSVNPARGVAPPPSSAFVQGLPAPDRVPAFPERPRSRAPLATQDLPAEETRKSARPKAEVTPARPQSEAPQSRFHRSEAPAAARPRAAFVHDSASDAAITARLPAARTRTPIIAVTSAKGGAGRTTLSLNLAVSLARRGRRVVVVDADASSLLPTLNVGERPLKGVADVLEGRAVLSDTVLETRVPGLKLVPSGDLSDDTYRHPGWQSLLTSLAQQADLVLVDCAPGWYGATLSVLAAASHQLLVLAAEPAARKVCTAYQARIEKLSRGKPELLGIVINMLDYQVHASVRSLEELSGSEYAQHVFDIPIPRSPAFMEASARGVPIVHVEQGAAPTIAWVFETLATAVLERLLLERPVFTSAPLLA
jgi:chromosome partitioning protein